MGKRKHPAKRVTFPGAHLYLSIEEAAKVAKVKPQTVRNWLTDKVLRAFKFKTMPLCSKEDLMAKIKKMK